MDFEKFKIYLEANEWVYYVLGVALALIIVIIAILISSRRKSLEKKRKVALDKKNEPVLSKENTADVQNISDEIVEAPITEENGEQEEVTENDTTNVEDSNLEEVEEEPIKEQEEVEIQDSVEEQQEKFEDKVIEIENVEEVSEEPIKEQVEVVEHTPKKEEVKKKVTPKSTVEKTLKTNLDDNVSKEIIEEIMKKTKKTVKGKYEIVYDGNFYHYTLKASNGGVLVESEPYETKDSILAAINNVKKNVEVGTIVIFKDKRGLSQFKLVAKNRRVLVVSANYATEKDAVRASESFKRFALNAEIVESESTNSKLSLVDLSDISPKKGGKIIHIESPEGFSFQLKANNGEILCSSNVYKSKNGALLGVETMKTAIKEGKFFVVQDKRGYSQFKLYSTSNRVVAIGESYPSKQQAIASARSVYAFMIAIEE